MQTGYLAGKLVAQLAVTTLSPLAFTVIFQVLAYLLSRPTTTASWWADKLYRR